MELLIRVLTPTGAKSSGNKVFNPEKDKEENARKQAQARALNIGEEGDQSRRTKERSTLYTRKPWRSSGTATPPFENDGEESLARWVLLQDSVEGDTRLDLNV